MSLPGLLATSLTTSTTNSSRPLSGRGETSPGHLCRKPTATSSRRGADSGIRAFGKRQVCSDGREITAIDATNGETPWSRSGAAAMDIGEGRSDATMLVEKSIIGEAAIEGCANWRE